MPASAASATVDSGNEPATLLAGQTSKDDSAMRCRITRAVGSAPTDGLAPALESLERQPGQGAGNHAAAAHSVCLTLPVRAPECSVELRSSPSRPSLSNTRRHRRG